MGRMFDEIYYSQFKQRIYDANALSKNSFCEGFISVSPKIKINLKIYFCSPDDKILVLEIVERNGARHQRIEIRNKQIRLARTL